MVEGSQNGGRVTGDSTSTIDNFPGATHRTIYLSAAVALRCAAWRWLNTLDPSKSGTTIPLCLGCIQRAWLQAPRCGRLHVSHSLDETAFGRSFCLCWAVRLRDAAGRWSASYERRSTRFCQFC